MTGSVASAPRYSAGDVVPGRPNFPDQGWLILSYHSPSDSYVMQSVYYQNDVKKWVFYEWKTSTSKRELVETIYPDVITRIDPNKLQKYEI